MADHGNGIYGTRVTYTNGEVNTFWCRTKSERDNDYKTMRKMLSNGGIRAVNKVER